MAHGPVDEGARHLVVGRLDWVEGCLKGLEEVRLVVRLSPTVYPPSYPYSNFTLRIVQSTMQNNIFGNQIN